MKLWIYPNMKREHFWYTELSAKRQEWNTMVFSTTGRKERTMPLPVTKNLQTVPLKGPKNT